MTQQCEFDSLPFRSFARPRQRRWRDFNVPPEFEIQRADVASVGHHYSSAHAVDKLAHVARPAIVVDGGDRIGRKAAHMLERFKKDAGRRVRGFASSSM